MLVKENKNRTHCWSLFLLYRKRLFREILPRESFTSSKYLCRDFRHTHIFHALVHPAIPSLTHTYPPLPSFPNNSSREKKISLKGNFRRCHKTYNAVTITSPIHAFPFFTMGAKHQRKSPFKKRKSTVHIFCLRTSILLKFARWTLFEYSKETFSLITRPVALLFVPHIHIITFL